MAFCSFLAIVKFKKKQRTAHGEWSIRLRHKFKHSIFWYDFSSGHFLSQNSTKYQGGLKMNFWGIPGSKYGFARNASNRWCQLADFRERGGLSFELRAVASESDSPSDAHDAHNFHTHNALLASARTPLRFNHKQLKPTPLIPFLEGAFCAAPLAWPTPS